jgi:hypothetical protein
MVPSRAWGGLGAAWVVIGGIVAACGGGDDSSNGSSAEGGADAQQLADSAPADSTFSDSATTDATLTEGSTTDASTTSDVTTDATLTDSQTDAGADGNASDAQDAADGDAGACSPYTDYYVDPNNGSDTNDTGCAAIDGGAGDAGCAFKTISHALTRLQAQCGATTLHVLGPASIGASETFPLVVPANVIVQSEGGPVTISVPATASDAFRLSGGATGLRGLPGALLTLSAAACTSTGPDYGVSVSQSAQAFLENVTVDGFCNTGVSVLGLTSLDVRQGVTITHCSRGLGVIGTVTLHVTSGNPVVISNNSWGIYVFGTIGDAGGSSASLDILGAPGGSSGTGTVMVNGNSAGVTIETPSGPHVIDGLAASGNQVGASITTGTSVRVRRSVFVNSHTGFAVVQQSNESLATIDLGTTASVDGGIDYGYNTFQPATDAGFGYARVGLVLSASVDAGTLNAVGNTFLGPRDCSQPDAGALRECLGVSFCGVCYAPPCPPPADISILANGYDGGVPEAGSYGGIDIDTSSCTH